MSTFSQKHYKKLAEILKEGAPKKEGRWAMALLLADGLQKDNSKFDRERFYHACGLREPEVEEFKNKKGSQSREPVLTKQEDLGGD